MAANNASPETQLGSLVLASCFKRSVFWIGRILSLPHELLHALLGSVTTLEPWTYTSTLEGADTISDEDVLLCTRDAKPVHWTLLRRHMLGLSSEKNWLLLVLSRHPQHLSRSDGTGISSAMTQALRRRNARLEQTYWAETGRDVPDARLLQSTLEEQGLDRAETKGTCGGVDGSCSVSKAPDASVCTDEECLSSESGRTGHSNEHGSNATALLALARAAPDQEDMAPDRPFSSIEAGGDQDGSRTGARCDRMRSMSGSTVGEARAAAPRLCMSCIWTVYVSENHGQDKGAEKRGSEERDVGVSPKRPRLSDYNHVSSGRVASLMDRFEKFHL